MKNEDCLSEKRSEFFHKIMDILDNAEAKEGSTGGAFGFLWDNSYVKRVVVSSFKSTHTNIAGLKMFLARNVLKMYPGRRNTNSGGMTFKQLKEIVDGTANGHKYQLNYSVMDDCMDIEKNKKAMLECMHAPIEDADMIRYIEECNVCFPYIFMDKLREEVWFHLREFSKLCDQKICNECLNKGEAYFRFIEAVALYEIFYIELIQEPAAEYVEKINELTKEMQGCLKAMHRVSDMLKNTAIESALEELLEETALLNNLQLSYEEGKESPEDSMRMMGIWELLVIEFAISLHAMCDLLMIFEAVYAGEAKMRGIERLGEEIGEKLSDIYGKDLYILENAKAKRYKRHREANIYLEKMQKNKFPECEDLDIAGTIYTFLDELGKPVQQWNRNLLRGLEVLLAYPVYKGETVFGGIREE